LVAGDCHADLRKGGESAHAQVDCPGGLDSGRRVTGCRSSYGPFPDDIRGIIQKVGVKEFMQFPLPTLFGIFRTAAHTGLRVR
jgi:hypothetical protein